MSRFVMLKVKLNWQQERDRERECSLAVHTRYRCERRLRSQNRAPCNLLARQQHQQQADRSPLSLPITPHPTSLVVSLSPWLSYAKTHGFLACLVIRVHICMCLRMCISVLYVNFSVYMCTSFSCLLSPISSPYRTCMYA